ncbi:hypothetical protein [Catenulispora pinisilvae]|uniref:hypothetical protein n=1 Tax=Catenulispora pinisilvae TaxID=2705253 RepID=UPI001891BAE4|nr:hypothetical protein [Catenulispora pinisilvae]
MTTPTPEDRDERGERAPRPHIDLSVTKIAAGACAAALAAAVGSKLGVAGTIVGAAVASTVATSASALIGHSLERGKTAARKAMPVLDPEAYTTILSRARIERESAAEHDAADREARTHLVADDRAAADATRVDAPRFGQARGGETRGSGTRDDETRINAARSNATRVDETRVELPTGVLSSDLDQTIVLHGGTPSAAGPNAETVVLPTITAGADDAADAPQTWKDRLPGRKPMIAAAIASFVIGTGAVTALEVARKGEFPGYHSNVFDPGTGGDSNNHQPASQDPSGTGGTHKESTPSQKPDSPSSSGSGSGAGGLPSNTPPSTPSPSGSGPSTPSAPSSTPSTSPSTSPSSIPSTPQSSGGSTGPTTAPTSSAGGNTPSTANTGAGKATPSGGAAG